MKKYFSILNILILVIVMSCSPTKKTNVSDLYKSSDFTAVNSFTSGAEGPAVDTDGNLYAVNFAKEGTIGKITPTGNGSIFIELPNGSVGNGIRFNSRGDMLIAEDRKSVV